MTLEQLQLKINTTPALMLYFSAESCSVCKVIKPKLFDAFEKRYPKVKKIDINGEIYKDIAAYFSVFTFPTIIIFFDGKEFFKKSRNLSIDGFLDEVERPYSLFF